MKLLPLSATLLLIFAAFSCGEPEKKPTQNREPIQQEEQTSVQKPSDETGIKADYSNSDRLAWQRPSGIINLLGNDESLKEKTVADIGAGTGFFTLRLASKVKKVIALDIDPHFVSYLDSIKTLQLPENIQPRLESRLTPRDRPNLEDEEVDAVLIVNTFMFIENKIDYLTKVKNALAEGGRLVIVDFKRKRTPFGPPAELRLPLYQTEEMLYEAGYKNITTDDRTLDYQYIVVAHR